MPTEAADKQRELSLSPDLTIPMGEGTVSLTEPVHSEALAERWRAEGDGASFEVLFTTPEALLCPQTGESICGWDHLLTEVEGHAALIFRCDQLSPLEDAIARDKDADLDADREHRLAIVLSLCEQLEALHEVGAIVAHATLEHFALRTDRDSPEIVLRCPELLHPLDHPPESGSFKGSGLDAPELTGVIVRPVDVRADVFLVGMIAYALFSGLRPNERLEEFTHRLPRLRAFDRDIPIGVDACVRRALSRMPESRFETISGFAAALRSAWEHGGESRKLVGPDRRVWITYAADTAIGQNKRERYPINQDNHLELFASECGWGIFSVLDGVSRCEIGTGELASWSARNTLEAQWHRKLHTPIFGKVFDGENPFPVNLLTTMAERAHEQMFYWLEALLAIEDPGSRRSTPCTTMSTLGLFGDRAALCNVGDSPLYLVRIEGDGAEDGFIEQLSIDQTGALENMRRGLRLPDAMTVINARWLHQAVGKAIWRGDDPPEPGPEPIRCETWSFRLRPGDMILITSDGVPGSFGHHPEPGMLKVLREVLGASWPGAIRPEVELTAAVRALVGEADRLGGRDNMTAILISIGPHTEDLEGY